MRVTLGAGVELDVKRVDARVRVVLEELLKSGRKFSGGSVVIGDQIEELGGDSGVNPLDDHEVIFQPARIGGARRRGWVDMVAKATLAKMDVEEMAPVVEVMSGEIKQDRNKGRDVGNCISKRGLGW
jgi:hypothetical protein